MNNSTPYDLEYECMQSRALFIKNISEQRSDHDHQISREISTDPNNTNNTKHWNQTE